MREPMIFTEAERNFALDLLSRIRIETTGSQVGVSRPSYGHGETKALNMVDEAARESGLLTQVDDAANLLMRVDNSWTGDMVAIGSHLDAVPSGGNFDGLAGVVAALLILRKAKDRGRKDILGIGLRGEESAWFGIPYMGAKAALGKLTSDDLWKRTRNALPLGRYMGQCGALVSRIEDGDRILSPAVKEFWELHIEQGPELVDRNVPVGVVDAVRGNVRAPKARMFGQAGHSGTTPHRLRKDAVLRFAELLTAAEGYRAELHHKGFDIVLTCGIVGTVPEKHAMTTIADEVEFSLDIRSVDMKIARQVMDFVKKYAGDNADWGTVVETEGMTVSTKMTSRALAAANGLGISAMRMPSGAGHDAVVFNAAGIPSGMIFVRNRNGSHNPHEDMDIDDFMLGVETLYATLGK